MKQFLAAALLSVFSLSVHAGPVNVNAADAKTLAKELDGVGEKTADAIVDARKDGPFKDAADLNKRVKGVGDKTIEKNKANLKFS